MRRCPACRERGIGFTFQSSEPEGAQQCHYLAMLRARQDRPPWRMTGSPQNHLFSPLTHTYPNMVETRTHPLDSFFIFHGVMSTPHANRSSTGTLTSFVPLPVWSGITTHPPVKSSKRSGIGGLKAQVGGSQSAVIEIAAEHAASCGHALSHGPFGSPSPITPSVSQWPDQRGNRVGRRSAS